MAPVAPRKPAARTERESAVSASAARHSGRIGAPKNIEARNGSRPSKNAVCQAWVRGNAEKGTGRKNSRIERGLSDQKVLAVSGSADRAEFINNSAAGSHIPALIATADTPLTTHARHNDKPEAMRIRRAAIMRVPAHISAEPASICAPMTAPRTRSVLPGHRASTLSTASQTQGIQAAPAMWCHKVARDSKGPLSCQATPPIRPARKEPEERRRASNATPSAPKTV